LRSILYLLRLFFPLHNLHNMTTHD
jgi:hypothetical protein